MSYFDRDYTAEALCILKELSVTFKLPVPESDINSSENNVIGFSFEKSDASATLLKYASSFCSKIPSFVNDSDTRQPCSIPWEKSLCDVEPDEDDASDSDVSDFDLMIIDEEGNNDRSSDEPKLPDSLFILPSELPLVHWDNHSKTMKEMTADIYHAMSSLLEHDEFIAALSHSASYVSEPSSISDWSSIMLFHGNVVDDDSDDEENPAVCEPAVSDVYDTCFSATWDDLEQDSEDHEKVRDLIMELPISAESHDTAPFMPIVSADDCKLSVDWDKEITESVMSDSQISDEIWNLWRQQLSSNEEDEEFNSDNDDAHFAGFWDDEPSALELDHNSLEMAENDALFLSDKTEKPFSQTVLVEASKMFSADTAIFEKLLQRFPDRPCRPVLAPQDEFFLHYTLNNVEFDLTKPNNDDEEGDLEDEELKAAFDDSFSLADSKQIDRSDEGSEIMLPVQVQTGAAKSTNSGLLPLPGLKFIPHIPTYKTDLTIAIKETKRKTPEKIQKLIPGTPGVDITFDIGDLGLGELETRNNNDENHSTSGYFDETWNNSSLDFMLQAHGGSMNQTMFAPQRSVIRNRKRKC